MTVKPGWVGSLAVALVAAAIGAAVGAVSSGREQHRATGEPRTAES